MSDQLSSDLASLRIDRDRGPESGSGFKKWLVVLAVLGGVGAVAYLEYPRARAEIFKTEVAVTEVTSLSPVQSSVQVTATGYIVPQLVTKVGPHDTGRLARVLVKEGDTVKAGQTIAIFDTLDQRSALAASSSRIAVAQAKVETAKATLAETKQKVDRERPLVEHGAVSKSVLDDLVAQEHSLEQQVKAAQAEVVAAQADLASLNVSLQQRTVVAPIDGTVVSKPMEPGQVTSPGDVAPIVELVDFKSLLAEVDVPEGRLSSIKLGGPAEIALDAYPDKHYRGEVVGFGKRVDRAKATLVVKVKFTSTGDPDGGALTNDEPPAGVLPEMSVRVSFLSAPVSDDALRAAPKHVVSQDAIADRNGKKVVFVVESSQVHSVQVTPGGPVGSSVELVDGPPPGTRVVSSPPPELSDGMKIKEKGT